jgi:hypothetical protein
VSFRDWEIQADLSLVERIFFRLISFWETIGFLYLFKFGNHCLKMIQQTSFSVLQSNSQVFLTQASF